MSEAGQLEARVSDLRKRMAEAGCVFKFTVSSVSIGREVSEIDHRHALEELFETMRQRHTQHRLNTIAREPSTAALKFFTLEFDPSLATAAPLDWLEVDADGSSWLTRLEHAVVDPPYGSRADAALFAEFCAVVGIASDAVMLDWVGHPDLEPERSAWSNFFEAGNEWWSIWCATIWNPTARTLAAIAASSTD